MTLIATSRPALAFPAVSVAVLHGGRIAILTDMGEIVTYGLSERFKFSALVNRNTPVLTCHAPWTGNKIAFDVFPAFDALELFAFCKPGVFCTPTINGLSRALGINPPDTPDDAPFTLIEICQSLLYGLWDLPEAERKSCYVIANAMARQGHGWAWAPFVIQALGGKYDIRAPINPKQDLDIFASLPEWSEEAPPPPSSYIPVTGEEAREHLQTLLSRRQTNGRQTQIRAQQLNYTTRIADILMPKQDETSPHLLVAQAGTGIGKTYGYLAPAQVWSEKNEGSVTVSTFTKNLQRQIEQDLDILYPDVTERNRKAVIQKGRENYLCLLNLEDLINSSATAQSPRTIIAAGLMARWATATNDGDLTGNSFPGWLTGLLSPENTLGLADRRGECVFAACDHYHKCFIERMNRRARRARIVINNHALTLIRAATAQPDQDNGLSPYIVFDEAHHLFHAADSAFGANLTGLESADLRRWLVGPEDENRQGRANTRGRGLRKRLEGLISEDEPAYHDIGKIIVAAKETLPGPGWRKRVFMNEPFGVIEHFLAALAQHTRARAKTDDNYTIETDIFPLGEMVADTARAAVAGLKKIRIPLQDLAENLKDMTDNEDLDADTVKRVESLATGIEYRSAMVLAAWINMLELLSHHGEDTPAPEDIIDWFEITRIDGKDYDCGYMRRYLDPMKLLGQSLRHQTQGVVMTSATLRTHKGDDESGWEETNQSLGTAHLTDMTPVRIDLESPFDYKSQSRIIIINDVDKNNAMAVANAYKVLFEASKGGALGLFTAVRRLKQVYRAIGDALEQKSLPVYAQHHGDIDIGTLTDMFRDDPNASLLGTDAVRDGIDVAGDSLRLMVFDRVPWPRPTILHRERRKVFGGKDYDDNLTRLKLKQAYGRLIRSEHDKGVFVMLDSGFPTRLCNAFPDGVDIQRIGLKDAVAQIKEFLSDPKI